MVPERRRRRGKRNPQMRQPLEHAAEDDGANGQGRFRGHAD